MSAPRRDWLVSSAAAESPASTLPESSVESALSAVAESGSSVESGPSAVAESLADSSLLAPVSGADDDAESVATEVTAILDSDDNVLDNTAAAMHAPSTAAAVSESVEVINARMFARGKGYGGTHSSAAAGSAESAAAGSNSVGASSSWEMPPSAPMVPSAAAETAPHAVVAADASAPAAAGSHSAPVLQGHDNVMRLLHEVPSGAAPSNLHVSSASGEQASTQLNPGDFVVILPDDMFEAGMHIRRTEPAKGTVDRYVARLASMESHGVRMREVFSWGNRWPLLYARIMEALADQALALAHAERLRQRRESEAEARRNMTAAAKAVHKARVKAWAAARTDRRLAAAAAAKGAGAAPEASSAVAEPVARPSSAMLPPPPAAAGSPAPVPIAAAMSQPIAKSAPPAPGGGSAAVADSTITSSAAAESVCGEVSLPSAVAESASSASGCDPKATSAARGRSEPAAAPDSQ